MLHRGQCKTASCAGAAAVAGVPQCGQCLLPINIIAKQDGQATVASFDSQYRQSGAPDDIAAPQFGQLRASACMPGIVAV